MEKITIKLPETPKVSFGTTETSKLRKDINFHIADKSNPHAVTKSQIGLGNVDNTSDVDKPIGTATQAALNKKANKENGIIEVEGHYSDLIYIPVFTDTGTTTTNHLKAHTGIFKVKSSSSTYLLFQHYDSTKGISQYLFGFKQLSYATCRTRTFASTDSLPSGNENAKEWTTVLLAPPIDNLDSESAVFSLSANQGHVLNEELNKINMGVAEHMLDLVSHIFQHERENWNVAANDVLNLRTSKLDKESFDAHALNEENPHRVTKSQIGLGNVDNTSDVDKPISTSTQEALDKKEDASNKSTVIDENSIDEQYPSSKAVKNYVDAGLSDAQELIDANTIVESAEGKVINITDSANAKLRGLRIFGKTTQADVPSFDNPQGFVNVGSDGSVGVEFKSKNLFNFNIFEKISKTLSLEITDNTYKLSGIGANQYFVVKFLVKKGETYTFSVKSFSGSSTEQYTGRIRLGNSDSPDKSEYGTIFYTSERNSVTFTATTSEVYIKGYINNENSEHYIEIEEPQLEHGTATTYEPFKEPQILTLNTPNGLPGIPVTFDGNYTDENGQQYICDEIDLTRGKYVQRVNKYICTGDEGWLRSVATSLDSNEINIEMYRITISDGMILKTGDSRLMCSHAEVSTQAWNRVASIGKISNTSITILQPSFSFYEGTYETLDKWKAKVKALYDAETPIEILYILAEPIERDLTDEEIAQYKALTTHKPVTNVFNDADAHIKIDYVADTKNYIDNKFAQLQANILNVVE